MNGARSTFKRKGYLLTALAAAVLLAASPGTASAQSVGFVGSSGTVGEGAAETAGAPASPLLVTIRISGLVTGRTGALGDVTLEHNADPSSALTANKRVHQVTGTDVAPVYTEIDSGGILSGTTANGDLTLAIMDPAGDGDWKDNKFTMTLRASGPQIVPSPAQFTVTVTDSDTAPVATFSKTSISLTEDSSTPVKVGVNTPRNTPPSAIPAALADIINTTTRGRAARSVLLVTVDPADALDDDGEAKAPGPGNTNDDGPIEITKADGTYLSRHMVNGRPVPGTYVVGNIDSLQDGDGEGGGPQNWTIRATKDMAGFRSPMITLSFAQASLKTDAGDVQAGPSLSITVQSDEPVPTVSFATGSLSIAEGSTETVAILADAATGPEVGSVMVSKSGDAMLSLWQGSTMLEAGADGNYEVDLMGNANTILTISADSDRALEDGMTASGTITIVSASGANIGSRNSVTVTVNGSTAVPALPLVGQLLLALFLMAGGSRLYRRRRG